MTEFIGIIATQFLLAGWGIYAFLRLRQLHRELAAKQAHINALHSQLKNRPKIRATAAEKGDLGKGLSELLTTMKEKVKLPAEAVSDDWSAFEEVEVTDDKS